MTQLYKFLIIAFMLIASVLSFLVGDNSRYPDIIANKGFMAGGKTYTCTTNQ